MSTFRMLDSITPANLPAGADAYLGYADGAWATAVEIRAMFPRAHHVTLAVFAQDDAEGLDIENGDATIPQVYGWFRRQEALKVWRPVLYISAANAGSLLATMTANGFARSSFRLLTAHYGMGKHICGPSTCGYPEADGTQWTDSAPGNHGSLIDESELLPSFFPAPPAPPKPPPPAPHHTAIPLQGDDGTMLIPDGYAKTVAVPVPLGVPLPGGAWGVPSVVRLTSSSPANFNIAFGNTEPAAWQPVSTDYAQSPKPVPLPLDGSGNPVAVLKLQPPSTGNLATVIVDFA